MSNSSSSGRRDPFSENLSRRPVVRSRLLKRRPISPSAFVEYTSVSERATLREKLIEVLRRFLSQGSEIYLEGLGILFLVEEETRKNHLHELSCVIRTERHSQVRFEKCSRLSTFHRGQYTRLVESDALAERVFLRLPLPLQIRWGRDDTHRYLISLIHLIKNELTVDGYSAQLLSLGELFALHNRQGKSVEEWFAGADIFIEGEPFEPLSLTDEFVFQQPTLASSWELFEAAFDEAAAKFRFPVEEELAALGYDAEEVVRSLPREEREISVGIFHSTCSNRLVFVTDGLRKLERRAAQEKRIQNGTEFVVQIPFELERGESLSQSPLPSWPLRMLTLGWIMIQSASTRRVDYGVAIGGEKGLIDGSDTRLQAVMAVPCKLAPLPQRSDDGSFSFRNLVGITEDELRLSRNRSWRYLSTLLASRDFDQVTKPERRSILRKSRHSISTNKVH